MAPLGPWGEQLGRGLTEAWRAVNRDDSQFARLAAERLREAAPIDFAALLAEAMGSAHLPAQGKDFASLVLFASEDLEVRLRWFFGPETEWAAYSGAACVVRGDCLLGEYTFLTTAPRDSALRIGDFSLRRVTRESTGAVYTFDSDGTSVQRIIPLDRRSIHLVVRSKVGPVAAVTDALLPGIVRMVTVPNEWQVREEQLIDMLRDIGESTHEDFLREGVQRQDLGSALTFLRIAARGPKGPLLEELTGLARKAHGGAVEPLLAAVLTEARERNIATRLSQAKDARDRFLWAVLLAKPSETQLRELVPPALAGEPVEALLAEWRARAAEHGAD